jgi:hypothetical protein
MWNDGNEDSSSNSEDLSSVTYQTDKFIHACGMASSITEAKRLRLAGAISIEIHGIMTKVFTPYITFIFPFCS